jgi:nucleotidyltransferase/DNA polymerase involved in DNA repair
MKARRVAAAFLPGLIAKSQVHLQDAVERRRTVYFIIEDDADPQVVLRQKIRIHDATSDLRALGIVPPMPLAQVQDAIPEVQVQWVRKAQVRAALLEVAEACLSVSPVVEPLFPEGVWLELTGLPSSSRALAQKVLGLLQRLGHEGVVAISPEKELAFALARHGQRQKQRIIITPDRGAKVAARLPLGTLALPPGVVDQLSELGLSTLGEAMALSQGGLALRLGRYASRVQALWSGSANEPLAAFEAPPLLEEAVELDHDLSHHQPLLFVSRPLFERLARRLEQRNRQLTLLEVVMGVRTQADGGGPLVEKVWRLEFPEPLDCPRALHRAFSRRLERDGLAGPLRWLRLVGKRLTQRVALQRDAFAPDVAVSDQLAGLLAELQDELGQLRVGCLFPGNSPLPEHMSELLWPPRPTHPPGLWMSRWPWPLRLLKAAHPIENLAIRARKPLGILEGEDATDQPYLRVYHLLTLEDGRRALGASDPETGELWVCGWFD